MTLQEKIQADMAQAMREKDALRLGALRMVKAAVQNKQVERMKTLDESEVLALLNTLVKQRRDSAEQFRTGNREELALKEESEIRIIESYLPRAASDEEIRQAVEDAMTETVATSMKDMGKMMKAVMPKLTGKTVDGSRVSQIVKERLS